MDPSLVFDIAGLVFKFLGSPMLKEIKSIWKYEEEIQMLADTVDIIGDVLNDVKGIRFREERVNKGYYRLREAYLDAEDFLDRVHTLKKKQELMATQIKEAKAEIIKPNGKGKLSLAYVGMKMKPTIDKGRRFFSSSNQAKYAVEVHNAIKEIRKKLDAISQDQKFGLVEPSSRSEITLTTARATGFYVDATRIIGRDEDKRKIVSLLLKSSVDDRKIPVISIVGMGGMGKTTIAQLVFDDKCWQTSCQFDIKMWVSDSKKYDLKLLLKHILKDIDPKDTSLDSLEEDHLKQRLVDEIQGKRFLLVLDDVDSEDPHGWEKLEELLEKGNKGGSRILVTTRSRKVAKVVGSLSDSTYELHGLLKEDSLQLFKRCAFQERWTEDLVEIGKQIVRKCSGAPLAVKVIGSYLKGKDKHEWEYVRDNSFADIPDEGNQLLPILKLSYDDLDVTAKQCFSYCALIPRNHRTSKEGLKSIWMDHIRFKNGGRTLEDVCDKNLRILLNRCFLEGAEDDDNITIHDLMLDLAREVARPDILVVDSNLKVDLDKIIVEENVLHLLLTHEAPTVQPKGKRLRTIIRPFGRPKITLSGIVSECPVVRVLDMSVCGIENLTDSIGKLIHLRYLSLDGNNFQTLPNSITELINLTDLILSDCKNLTHLPSGMGGLTSLEHLTLNGCNKLVELPRGIVKLMKLKKLLFCDCQALAKMPSGMGTLMPVCDPPRFIVGHPELSNCTAQLEELGSLSDLAIGLFIELPRDITSKKPAWDGQAFLLNKKSLQMLVIIWQGNPNPEEEVLTNNMDILEKFQPHPNLNRLCLDGYQGRVFPPWVQQHGFDFVLPNLTHLRIKNCRRCQYLPSFSRLHCLKDLGLYGLCSLEYIEENDSTAQFCLPQLETLELRDLPQLKGWCRWNIQWLLLSSFPRLSVLNISSCPNLMVPPLFSFAEESDLESRAKEGLYPQVDIHIDDLSLSLFLGRDDLCLLISNFNATESALSYMAETFREMSDRLTHLCFLRCSGLKTFPGILQHLGTLRMLAVLDCPYFTWEEEEEEKKSVADEIQSTSHDARISWKDLSSLRELTLKNLPKMMRLPEGIQFLTSLQMLCIYGCDDLFIPEWLPKILPYKKDGGGWKWFHLLKKDENWLDM